MARRNLCFGLFVAASMLAFSGSLSTLVRLAIEEPSYSHILMIGPVAAALLYRERHTITANAKSSFVLGSILLTGATIVAGVGHKCLRFLSANDGLALTMLALVLFWIAGFVLCYGYRSLSAGLSPLLFLFLLIPIPDFLVSKTVILLQQGSAESLSLLLRIAGVPFVQKGLVFSLPGVDIQIATQCSGIRAGLVLLVASLVAGHLLLNSTGTRVLLALSVLPIVIAKNGLRIFALAILGIYVDPGFLKGSLHQYGGMPFFVLSLLALRLVVWLLQKARGESQSRADHGPRLEALPRPQ
jgi:exosortase